MSRIIPFLIALCLALPAAAEQKRSFGDLDVHYSAFNSSFLLPDIAAAANLTRSKELGVINIAVRKADQPVAAQVNGQVRNLLGQVHNLQFKQVKEGEAIYYLAQFPFSGRETLRFNLQVEAAGGPSHSFDFSQEFFPDE